MIVLPAEAPPARRWLAHLVRTAAGASRAGDRFDDVFAFDPEAVGALARRHGVAPLLHRGLETGRIADPLPQAFRREVAETWSRARRRSAAVLEAGSAALAELASAGVRAVPVGAFALVRGKDDLYLEPGLRPVEAADLVLPDASWASAAEALRGLGFAPAPLEGAPGGPLRLVRRVQGTPVPLVLRTALRHGRARGLSGARFLARHAEPAEGGRVEAALAGHVLFAATRLARGGPVPWIEVVDMHRLVEARPDWSALVREARESGLRRALYVGLATSRELLRSPIPKEVLSELAPGRLRRRLLHWRLAAEARETASSAPASAPRPAPLRPEAARGGPR